MKMFTELSRPKRNLLLPLLLLSSFPVHADCVVLLHGLWRSPASMEVIEGALIEKGYTVVNAGYPSRAAKIETLSTNTLESSISLCPEGEPIHFVTHSLGGILLRQYASDEEIPGLGRVVMLGPPNQGSEVVDKLGDIPGFAWMNGPAGLQLGTDENSVPRQLGKVSFELGVIAGTRSINWMLSLLIPGQDDGKVSVENTRVEGMASHIALPANHALMMRDPDVVQQVIYFLQNGEFYQTAAQ